MILPATETFKLFSDLNLTRKWHLSMAWLDSPLSSAPNKYTHLRGCSKVSKSTARSSSSTPTKRAPLGRFLKKSSKFS